MKIFLSLCLVIGITSAHIVPESKLLHTRYQLDGRITNGEVAKHGQFPYQCGLNLISEEGSFWCGCSIISESYVLTAAHCAEGVDSAVVIVGAQNVTDQEEANQRRYSIDKSQITVHEGWNPSTLSNDIAVIRLETPLELNEYVQAATLPKISSVNETYEGETVVASGWGRYSDKANSISSVLRYVEVVVMNTEKCSKYYFGAVNPSMICISTKGGTSTCNGDSGGPLVRREGDVNYLIGATSFGLSLGCEVGWPAVFTRITAHLDWIKEHTGIVNE